MGEDKFKKLIGKDYTDNYIVNYLLYFEKNKKTEPTPERLFNKNYIELVYKERQLYFEAMDEWRIENDLDVLHLNGDLNADTIFSVWMPLKMCLQCSTSYPYSDYGNEEKPYKGYPYLSNIIKKIDEYLPLDEWEELYEFAKLAMTKANVMRLPERGMQARGEFLDQMPKTLYECFAGGRFARYFEKVSVEDWVTEQNLEMFFEDKDISRRKIYPLIKGMNANQFVWLKEKDKIKEMLSNYTVILNERMDSLKGNN